MWCQFRPFADADFVRNFTLKPEERYFEMMLACWFMARGEKLLPRAKKKIGGPDLCIEDGCRRIWVEAVCPRVSKGASARNFGVDNGWVNSDQFILRFTQSFDAKARQLSKHINSSLIGEQDVCVIAICGGQLGLALNGADWLKALFPFGQEIAVIRNHEDRAPELIDYRNSRQTTTHKPSGEPVSKALFFDGSLDHVAAVIYQHLGMQWETSMSFDAFRWVRNPNTATELGDGWLQDVDQIVYDVTDNTHTLDLVEGRKK